MALIQYKYDLSRYAMILYIFIMDVVLFRNNEFTAAGVLKQSWLPSDEIIISIA